MTDNSTPDEGQGNRGRDGYNNDRRPPRRDGAPGGRGPRRDDDRRGGPRRDDRGERRSYGDRDDRRGPRRDGDRKPWANRDERPRRDDDRGQRRSYGDRDDRRGPREGGDRKAWDDRGQRRSTSGNDGERRTWGDRREGPRPERRQGGGPRGDGGRGPRQEGERRSWGDRDDRRGPRRDDRGERRSFGDRDDRRGPRRDDRRDDRGERRTFGDRDNRRPYGDRDDRRGPRSDDRGERRSYGDRDNRRSYGDRDDRSGPRRDDRGERRSWGERDARRGPRRDERRDDRGQGRPYRDRDERWEEREERIHPPGTAPRPDEPDTPTEWNDQEIHPGVKAELKGLPKDLADTVAAHIWAAGQLIDEDPALAFRHAEAARRRAGRLPIVREAAAETAYAAGEFAVALREFRAIRRMSGGDELIPLIADCERALGRHRDALEVLNELNPKHPDANLHIECLLVEAGIRDDLGQRDEALRLLTNAVSRKVGPPPAQARLQYALANLLEETGDLAGAHRWFSSAATLDRFGDLDTADRLAALDGITLPEDFSDEDDAKDEQEDDLDGESQGREDLDGDPSVDALPADETADEPLVEPGSEGEEPTDNVEGPTTEETDR